MATSQTASDVVRALGVLTTFWKKVESAIRDVGGNDEHIARLAKDDSNSAIKRFAEIHVYGSGYLIDPFRVLIAAGKYDNLYGFAENPEEIRGQARHSIFNETELDYPVMRLTCKQVCDKYGDKMATLSELLAYGINNPDTQRSFPIGIVWKDGDQFWFAILGGDGSRRRLVVYRGFPYDEWHVSCRFLLRK